MTAGEAERDTPKAEGVPARPFRLKRFAPSLWSPAFGYRLALAALGALLILLLTQIPAAHRVDVGGFDAAYLQGFHDPEPAGVPALTGGDGSARWTRPSAALLLPQAGLPGTVTLRLRGWREAGPPPEVVLLLNGQVELARFQAGGAWEERSVAVTGGWLKATDFFVEIRSAPATLADGREVGVLVDRAVYTVGPGLLAPYPAQLLYGAAVGLLLALLIPRRRPALAAVALLAYGLVWLVLYRLQPPLYPYPLRAFPPLAVLALAAALVVRDGPRLAARAPWLVGRALPAAVVAGWTATTLLAARGHVTLSRPGVENDFRVFATRETLPQIFSADGFYNLGYPLLLWLARPLAEGNAFLAGRLLAALCGAAFLAAGYWLARALLPASPALVALLALALSAFVAQYGLYVGSDMPLAASAALCLAALAWACRADTGRRHRLALVALAGLSGGLAFLMRHPGLLLLPWGALALLALLPADGWRLRLAAPGLYALAFLLAITPQLAVNLAEAGDPLYNQQAKNIWLAVYGGGDWGRWEEAPNDIGLAEVLLRDPGRFLENWGRNMAGYAGSGAEDTSEFGRAIQLRLLGWPANWLAVAGLLGWLLLALRALKGRSSGPSPAGDLGSAPTPHALGAQRPTPHALGYPLALLALVALYVAAVSTAFTLQRFFLPLAPIYAAAAGWALWRLAGGGRALLGAALALVVVLWGGFGAGASYVLANQPADEVAAVAMVQAAAPDAPIAARVAGRLPLAKYSALAHQVVDWPVGSDLAAPVTAADLAAARAAGADFLLWDEASGLPPLSDPEAARVAASGRYALYRLDQ
jgi:4-amino-4-deoxy-L-arabinose transferase-like glycosyltransferase